MKNNPPIVNRNWEEDYEDDYENRYLVKCQECGMYFLGGHGRHLCKVCLKKLEVYVKRVMPKGEQC